MISGPLSEAIGLAVLHSLWQGTLIAVALAVALRLLARSAASVRYAVSCGALGAFVVFGLATAFGSYDPQTYIVLEAAAATGEVPMTAAAAAPAVAPGMFEGFVEAVRRHSSTIALLWLAGVVVLTVKLTILWTRARGLAWSGVAPAPLQYQHAVNRLAAALGVRRAVQLLESAAVEVPSVVGFLKPVILMPASSLSGLSVRQLELILAHELAHIRRHDFLVNMLQSVAETLLFYHPAAWWVSRQIRIERENCCDDLAVATCGDALEYARALTVLEELRSASSLAVAANGGSLLGRIRRLVARGDGRSVNGWTALAAATTFALVMLITSLPVHADRDTAAPPAPPAAPAAKIEVLAPKAPLPAPEAPTPVAPPVPVADLDLDVDVDLDVDLDEIDADPDVVEDDDAAGEEPDDEPRAPAPRPDGRLTVDELIALRVHGITPEYISEMRGVFGGDLSIRSVTQLKAMNVTPKYVADMRAAGVAITRASEAVSLRAMNVTPEFVRSIAAAGYSKLTARDLVRLAAAGVNADFIREMQKFRNGK